MSTIPRGTAIRYRPTKLRIIPYWKRQWEWDCEEEKRASTAQQETGWRHGYAHTHDGMQDEQFHSSSSFFSSFDFILILILPIIILKKG